MKGFIKVYSIAFYKQLYNPTNTSGGELQNASYVKLPVKPRGKGLRALLRKPRGLEVFGIWSLLLQAATETTKPKLRGLLLNHRDKPADITEIAEAVSLDRQISKVKHALKVLVEIGWIEYRVSTESVQNDSVPVTDTPPPKIREDKLSEVKGKVKAEESFKNYWNTKKTLPKIQAFSSSRKNKLSARMKESCFMESWRVVIDKIADSAFCCGKNDRGWKADCSWILTNSDNYVKVLEGKYDNPNSTPETQKTKLFPTGKNCSHKGCKRPAVYKLTGGAYDHDVCIEHAPAVVRENYCA